MCKFERLVPDKIKAIFNERVTLFFLVTDCKKRNLSLVVDKKLTTEHPKTVQEIEPLSETWNNVKHNVVCLKV